MFGPSRVLTNIDIYSGKNRYAEADALVLFGKQAIVVQAKSKRLTLNARKGNDLALKDDFKKAVANAYDQALLCAGALQRPSDFVFRDTQGQELKIAGLWNLKRLSRLMPSPLIGVFEFIPPCGRCQLYMWFQFGRCRFRCSEDG